MALLFILRSDKMMYLKHIMNIRLRHISSSVSLIKVLIVSFPTWRDHCKPWECITLHCTKNPLFFWREKNPKQTELQAYASWTQLFCRVAVMKEKSAFVLLKRDKQK